MSFFCISPFKEWFYFRFNKESHAYVPTVKQVYFLFHRGKALNLQTQGGTTVDEVWTSFLNLNQTISLFYLSYNLILQNIWANSNIWEKNHETTFKNPKINEYNICILFYMLEGTLFVSNVLCRTRTVAWKHKLL